MDEFLDDTEDHFKNRHALNSENRVGSYQGGKMIDRDTKFLTDDFADVKKTVKNIVENHEPTLVSFSGNSTNGAGQYVLEYYNVGNIGIETVANNSVIYAQNLRVVYRMDRMGNIIGKSFYPFI